MRLGKAETCWYIVMVGTLFWNLTDYYTGNRSIHVTGGISISPAFVVMFVMEHFRLSCDDALHMVQNRRYCISPNGGFLSQIKVWVHKYVSIDLVSQSVYYRSMKRYIGLLWSWGLCQLLNDRTVGSERRTLMMKSKYLLRPCEHVGLMFGQPLCSPTRVERKKHQPDPEVKEQRWLASITGGVPGAADVEMS